MDDRVAEAALAGVVVDDRVAAAVMLTECQHSVLGIFPPSLVA